MSGFGLHSASRNSRVLIPALAGGLIAVAALLGLAGSAQAKAILPSSVADPPSVCDAIAGNLVANCGFETGDFTAWTTTPAMMGSVFDVADFAAHSGTFGAFLAATTPPDRDTIAQSISTIAGDTYTIAFFLRNTFEPANQFIAMFGATTLLSLTDSPSFPYTEFTDTVVATGSSTMLSFSAYQVPGFFFVDDISVLSVAAPEPASLALLGSALFMFGVVRRRRRNPESAVRGRLAARQTDHPDRASVPRRSEA
jgi:hypothetical protein